MTVAICAIGMIGCTQPEPPHVHTFSEAWTTDATSHWHAATCEHTTEVSGKVDHQFPETWKLVTAATEEAAGLEERFCDICNYRATQVIPQLNHNHDIAKVWSTDSTKHWHTASCGREEHNEDVAEHIWNHEDYRYDSESGKNIRTCTVCLYVDDIAHVHTEDSGTVTIAPTCGIKGVKTFKCSVCDAVLRTEELPAKGHTEDSGTVTTAVTITTAGIKTYKCTACKAILRTENLPCPKLYSTPVTEVVNGVTYVYFGDWPQSVLPEASSVTVDETVSVIMGANTYYLGSDGNYYAKCAEKACGTDAQYKYHDGTQPGRGGTTTRYFKVEPIKWRVLTDNYSGKKLLLAENILTANVPYYKYYSYLNKRTVGSDTDIYHNNYKYSQIRAYLNGLDYYYDTSSTETTKKTEYTGKGFLQTAFTQDAQALIAETDVDNRKETTGYSESTYTVKYACENTTDKIFLLSESEVINSDYGFARYNSNGKGNARIRFPTDYAKANYAAASSTDAYGGYWWLRSPLYNESESARYVINDGYAGYSNGVNVTNRGVVPALSISF
ncbi:MAG: DUF6273 domain-containing protein [Treponema sp.]|uniref:DUF6273 domain-containing protein n=1 Tax=Treponema sp. TaxID=166 RepID=UPI00298E32AD|nr:DUF6273 domain-containing protein [Treponema sp.]MDD5810781.1 DUF6273 domain-containing protein [Treponema sp.]